MEQKNGAVVRQAVGYLRYDSAQELAVLSELYAHLRLYVNYFQPQMHLVRKIRQGSTVRRHHDRAQTPYQRLLAAPEVDAAAKAAMTSVYRQLNPVALRRDLTRLQARLLELAHLREQTRRKEVYAPQPDHPWRPKHMSQQSSLSRTS